MCGIMDVLLNQGRIGGPSMELVGLSTGIWCGIRNLDEKKNNRVAYMQSAVVFRIKNGMTGPIDILFFGSIAGT